jgi:DNA-binding beta-propeller fold protein YncE
MKQLVTLFAVLLCALAVCAQSEKLPDLGYKPVPDFLSLPPGVNFGEASGVALNSKGHLFVFNRGPKALMEFDRAGKFVRTIGEGMFSNTHGLRIDAQDNLWTTDIGWHVVLKFSPEGRILLVLGRKDRAGTVDQPTGLTLFDRPTDVAFGANGDIYVSDGYGNSRVVKFDRNANFLKTWGKKGKGEGEFDTPHTVAVDAKGLVYVGDRENRRVQVFDAEGQFVKQWTHVGSPWWLCFTPKQTIFLTDGYNNRLLKLDADGKILGSTSGPGKAVGQVLFPHGLAVGPAEELYVSEILNWRVQKFVRQ